MAPAKTGKDNRRRIAVINTAHTNNGINIKPIKPLRIFTDVVIKLIAPKIEEAPAKCKEKIAKSTEGPLWATLEESGG